MAGEGKSGKQQAQQEQARLRELTDALKQALEKCGNNPDGDAVHDTRTGTRRIEALLQWELREARARSGDEECLLADAVKQWEGLLKKIRRAAGPVRDLDVQRKLLKNVVGYVEARVRTPVDEPESGMAGQVDKLDDALKKERERDAARLKKSAKRWAAKLDGHVAELEAARAGKANGARADGSGRLDAATAALYEYARLAKRMPKLDRNNLHDFRKGAKKARYLAEAGGDDKRARDTAKALKKVQDAIGDWHDWLLLVERADKTLGRKGARLTAEIEHMRDAHFELAMKMERKIRSRLLNGASGGNTAKKRQR